MKKRITVLGLVLVCCIVLTGCGQVRPSGSVQTQGVQAAIQADCIVHYYKSNASAYMTRQQHGFDPDDGFFRSVSNEPTGVVECTLMKEDFRYSGQKNDSLSDLPNEFWNKNLAASVFYSFCAGGGLVNSEILTSGEKVKVEGQWYQTLTPDWPDDFKLTLLKSLDTHRIELIKMDDSQQELVWLLRSYNYRYSKELGKTLPRTIDVFNIHDGIASKALMIRFEYKDIRTPDPQLSSMQ